MTGRAVVLRTALALFPSGYRRERGDELAEVFADTTAGTGPLATAREALDLAAYGLRLRTGLTATALGGRLLAAAAPLLAGALLGLAALPGLGDPRTREVRVAARAGLAAPWAELPDRLAVLGLAVVPALLAVAALLGAWRAARTLALGTALLGALRIGLLAPAAHDGWLLLYGATALVPYLVGGALLVAAPPDLLEPPGRHSRLLVLGGAVAGFAVTRAQGAYHARYLMDGWRPLALLLVPLLLLVLCAARGRLHAAAAGVAVLPLTASFSLFSLWEQAGGLSGMLPWAAAGVVALAGAARFLAATPPRRPTG